MANRLPKECRRAGCPERTTHASGLCETHRAQQEARHAEQNKQRPSAHRRGYGRRWRKLRARFLRINPLCGKCAEEGLVVPATEVDHIVPHRGDPALMWDWSNLQSLCKSCHSRKTAKEDSLFAAGNRTQG